MDCRSIQAKHSRGRSVSRTRGGVSRYDPKRARSSPVRCGERDRPDRSACTDEKDACQNLTRGIHDALNTVQVAIVGGGPAGLTAALALIEEASLVENVTDGLPVISVTIFEKRSDPCRRQHVYLDLGRLGDTPAAGELRFDQSRLESLLRTHGVVPGPGASLELRVLEQCLMQLLAEKASSAQGLVAVRWMSRAFLPEDLRHFHHVYGADGRRSEVRKRLMERLPILPLKQRALEVEFEYNCHLQWQEAEKLHVLNPHKYGSWQPVILFHRLWRREMPEYIEITHHDYNVLQHCFRGLIAKGRSPFTTPFATLADFLLILDDYPETQRSVRNTLLGYLQEEFPDFDPCAPALVAPVELTLHRAPRLVSPASTSNSSAEPNFWLLGDAAVGLPVSKGCNLVYHMASAGKLANTLVRAADPKTYEDFVFEGWYREAWRAGRAFRMPLPSPNSSHWLDNFRATRCGGRFTK